MLIEPPIVAALVIMMMYVICTLRRSWQTDSECNARDEVCRKHGIPWMILERTVNAWTKARGGTKMAAYELLLQTPSIKIDPTVHSGQTLALLCALQVEWNDEKDRRDAVALCGELDDLIAKHGVNSGSVTEFVAQNTNNRVFLRQACRIIAKTRCERRKQVPCTASKT